MKSYRTLLFVPGSRERMLEKARDAEVDGVIIDLEDAVPPEEKPAARTRVRDWIAGRPRSPIFVRTNAPHDEGFGEDLSAIVTPGLSGIFVPKVNTGEEARAVGQALSEAERDGGHEPGMLEIVVMIESALGVHHAYQIASAPRISALCFGSGENGDFQTDMACEWSPAGLEMLYARSRVVLEARAAGHSHVFDGIFADLEDEDGLARDSELSRRLGYAGRAVIHPKQARIVTAAYTPSAEEVLYYRDLLSAYSDAVKDGRGAARFRGKMIDAAMAGRARRLLASVSELER